MRSYKLHTEHDVVVVDFTTLGLYEGPEMDELEELLVSEVVRSKTKRVVLDCARLQFVASRFLSLLAVLSRLAEEYKGVLAACGLRPQILKLLRLTGTDRLIAVHNSRQDAIAALSLPPVSP
jgi:anti-anti-sigma factor